MKKKIALLYGGKGPEHDVSVMGHGYVVKLLKEAEFDPLPIYIDKNGDWRIDELSVFPYRTKGGGILIADGGDKIKIDAAIPLLHGDGGESGEIQGLLKTAGIPFVGADVTAGAVCIDKHYTKCIADNLGVPVAKWTVFPRYAKTSEALSILEERLPFPVFIKPRRLGSSIGAHAVRNPKEFKRVFPEVSAIADGLVMAEELFDKKRELECAFYSARGVITVTDPGEILHDGFYGYDEKYISSAKISDTAKLDENIKRDIKKYTLLLSEACGLRHLGRIDYFLTEKGLVFNEINTFPGFTEKSLYPKMLSAFGISVVTAIKSFIEDAISDAGTF